MHSRKAIEALKGLANSRPDPEKKDIKALYLDIFVKATVLLKELEELNSEVWADADSPSRYVAEKIGAARNAFEIFCGFGEDGFDAELESNRERVLENLNRLENNTTDNGRFEPDAYFYSDGSNRSM